MNLVGGFFGVLVLVLQLTGCHPFVLSLSKAFGRCHVLGSSSGDDFYSDFDPSVDYTGGRQHSPPTQGRPTRGGQRGQYTRDVSRDESNVDVEAVELMLQDRAYARKDGDYDLADQIRDALLDQHGVAVFDKDRVWRTGCSRGGSGMPGKRRQQRAPRDFGPCGHDYEMSSDAGDIQSDLNVDEIDQLLAERLQCKLDRNFREADRLQETLLGHGVYVHDGKKEWRADGQLFGENSRDGRPGKERRNMYTRSECSDDEFDETQLMEISELVTRRSGAKQARNFQLADDIREDLKDRFNIIIDDRLQQWSTNVNFQNGAQDPTRPYAQSPDSEELDESSQQAVAELVAERSAAKLRRDYDTADSIREHLSAEFNVRVNDKVRQWSVGRRAPSGGTFHRVGGGDVTDETEIVVLIEDRTKAREKRDFDMSDRIRDELFQRFRVKVDDRASEWFVLTDNYSPEASSSHNLEEKDVEFIQDQLSLRLECKSEQRYDDADEIRESLFENYAVTIDDRLRTWAVEGGGESPQVQLSEPALQDGSESTQTQLFDDEEDSSAVSNGDYDSLTVVELKEKLRAEGLPVSGRKNELIARLVENA